MSLRLAKTIADAAAPLDPVADALQGAVKALPQPVRDGLDGVWIGNPLHPALTDVPIGAWTAAVMCDAAGADAAADAALTVGILGAVGAAVTGLNDWSHLRGDTKRLGFAHALLNTAGLALNIGSLVLRRRGRRDLGRALSAAAYGGAAFSAHLGGALSFGYGVRVNRTAWERRPDEFASTGVAESDLAGGALRAVEIDGTAVLLARSERTSQVCAIANTCTHLGGPLAEGERDGDTVVCPWHGSRFDLCTGAVEGGPAVYPEPRYEARVRDGTVEVRVSDEQ